MNKLTQERERSNGETESGIYSPEKTFENTCKNKIGIQENDNNLFVIDVTGQASNDANNRESDEDESDGSRSAGDNLFMVDTVGKDGENEDSDTEYDSDDENCVIGKIIFINFRTFMIYRYQRPAFRHASCDTLDNIKTRQGSKVPLCVINIGTGKQMDLWRQFGMATVMKVRLNGFLSISL